MLVKSFVFVAASHIGLGHAESWVVLRSPPETAQSPAGISVDSESIEILKSGIRRAKIEVDFLSRRLATEQFEGNPLSFTIWTMLYDFEKKQEHEDAMENHWLIGSVTILDLSGNRWYPYRENPRADPGYGFVCDWHSKSPRD